MKMNSSRSEEHECCAQWNTGKRIVDLGVLAEQLVCRHCNGCLDLRQTEREEQFGLASVLYITCICGLTSPVHTHKQHEGDDSLRLDVLVRGDGRQYIVNFLATLNIPLPPELKTTAFVPLDGSNPGFLPPAPDCQPSNDDSLSPAPATVNISCPKSATIKTEFSDQITELSHHGVVDRETKPEEVPADPNRPACEDRRDFGQTTKKTTDISARSQGTTQKAKTASNRKKRRGFKSTRKCAKVKKKPLQTISDTDADADDTASARDLDKEIADSNEDSVKIVYSCPSCGKNLPTASGFVKHMSRMHDWKNAPAQDYRRQVVEPADMGTSADNTGGLAQSNGEEMELTEDGRKMKYKYKCPECGKIIPSPRGFIIHMAKMHQTTKVKAHKHVIRVVEEPADEKPKTLYKCPTCCRILPSAKGFVVHMSRMHQTTDAQAHEHIFHIPSDSSAQNKDGTMLDSPTIRRLQQPGEDTFKQCKTCQQVFESQSSLMVHRHQAHPLVIRKKEHHCSQCFAVFKSATRLKHHKMDAHPKVKGEERVFTCEKCAKQFPQLCLLKQHARIHAGEKPFKCFHCEERFFLASHRNRHVIRRHLKVRKHLCTTCGSRFFTRGNLSTHERIHTGEKPFACTMCSRTFARQDTLILHERLHTGQRPYQCEVCDASFVQNVSLKCHYRSHHPELTNVKVRISKTPQRPPNFSSIADNVM